MLTVCFLWMTVCDFVRADELTQFKRASEKVTLATIEYYPPYAFKNKSGDWQGVDVAIAKRLFESLGFSLEIVSMPRKRILRMVKSNKIDGILSNSLYKNMPLKPETWYSDALYETDVALFSLQRVDSLAFNQIREEKGKIIGIIAGMDFDVGKLGKIAVNAEERLLNLLFKGRIDYAVADELAFFYAARKAAVHQKIKLHHGISTRQVKIGLAKGFLSRQHGAFTDSVNQSISTLNSSGFVDITIANYLDLAQFTPEKSTARH